MQVLQIQPGGTSQTLALVCFGIAILALMWVYRRHLARRQRQKRLDLNGESRSEMQARVDRAQRHIAVVEEKQRWQRLSESVPIDRTQADLDTDQAELLERIASHQARSASGRGVR